MSRKHERNHAHRNDDVHAIPAVVVFAIAMALLVIAGVIAIQEVNFWFSELTGALVAS